MSVLLRRIEWLSIWTYSSMDTFEACASMLTGTYSKSGFHLINCTCTRASKTLFDMFSVFNLSLLLMVHVTICIILCTAIFRISSHSLLTTSEIRLFYIRRFICYKFNALLTCRSTRNAEIMTQKIRTFF